MPGAIAKVYQFTAEKKEKEKEKERGMEEGEESRISTLESATYFIRRSKLNNEGEKKGNRLSHVPLMLTPSVSYELWDTNTNSKVAHKKQTILEKYKVEESATLEKSPFSGKSESVVSALTESHRL